MQIGFGGHGAGISGASARLGGLVLRLSDAVGHGSIAAPGSAGVCATPFKAMIVGKSEDFKKDCAIGDMAVRQEVRSMVGTRCALDATCAEAFDGASGANSCCLDSSKQLGSMTSKMHQTCHKDIQRCNSKCLVGIEGPVFKRRVARVCCYSC